MIVPLFGMDVSGAPSKSLNVNAQERLNLYTELRADTDKTRIDVFYATGGEWIGMRSTTHEGHVLDYRLR